MPICAACMVYLLYLYIYHKHRRNVGRHTIHGFYGVQNVQMSGKHFLSLNPPCKPECTAGITSHVPFSSLINLIWFFIYFMYNLKMFDMFIWHYCLITSGSCCYIKPAVSSEKRVESFWHALWYLRHSFRHRLRCLIFHPALLLTPDLIFSLGEFLTSDIAFLTPELPTVICGTGLGWRKQWSKSNNPPGRKKLCFFGLRLYRFQFYAAEAVARIPIYQPATWNVTKFFYCSLVTLATAHMCFLNVTLWSFDSAGCPSPHLGLSLRFAHPTCRAPCFESTGLTCPLVAEWARGQSQREMLNPTIFHVLESWEA